MTPALTPEQWDRLRADPYARNREFGTEDRQAIAARALYGESFGFTRADVALLRVLADRDGETGAYTRSTIRELADRIAALLPPDTEP